MHLKKDALKKRCLADIKLANHVRILTATSLFDGHDAAINIMRRLLQGGGAEVVHLGHNRGVDEVVRAAIQEDVQAIAISSYQGGHNEYFRYLVNSLKEQGAGHIKIFGGGGGVIVQREIEQLCAAGVCRIYSPEDGRKYGLEGIISHLLLASDFPLLAAGFLPLASDINKHHPGTLSRVLTWLENAADHNNEAVGAWFANLADNTHIPVIGLTGTGGAGKSSLTDELILRLRRDYPDFHIGILSIDPSRRRTGGALLGDRIRMNAIDSDQVMMRSMATRRAHMATAAGVADAIKLYRHAGFDLILVETAGIGQSDSEIVDLVDVSIYVMTPEFGAATQLEKIDMLDYADFVVLNKFEKRGGEDAIKAIIKQIRRNHNDFTREDQDFPVFGTRANLFNDPGVNGFYHALLEKLITCKQLSWQLPSQPLAPEAHKKSQTQSIIPAERADYLRKITQTVADFKQQSKQASAVLSGLYQLFQSMQQLGLSGLQTLVAIDEQTVPAEIAALAHLYNQKLVRISREDQQKVLDFFQRAARYSQTEFTYRVRNKEIKVNNTSTTLAGLNIPKVAVPRLADWGEVLTWVNLENFPGEFPYTAGVFPFKRQGEDPARMFAGEGGPERTNKRFHLLSIDQPANRLSTAFDSVTLYGNDPAQRPDIFGKIGNAGVSVASLDDAKRLYSGFDLTAADTSVSMTINGPAPMLMAFFLNAAIDQQIELHLRETGQFEAALRKIKAFYAKLNQAIPEYRAELPPGHNGLGLGLLGMSGDQLVDGKTYQSIKEKVLQSVRGTVQADILKEDQAQNTCIFSTEFALRLMGDVQAYFTQHQINNFYSVSISGYHIAEAGANPITQAAFTLANGFTFIEYYVSRGLKVDDFAANLSYFFSNGMDPEYAVIGRVARRIFAIALKHYYGANARSQKLKYHIQTSGRSLHAQEMDFNDIRTTLQALYAIMDNCNSLHTNAFDEAVTTPTENSVRRALAIQLIIGKELGLTTNENPMQGSYLLETLTDLVEEAILQEFLRISDRGGVLGAMETMYQRNRIQEESLHYETLKHSGQLAVVGVNTFVNPAQDEAGVDEIALARSSEQEKIAQLNAIAQLHHCNAHNANSALHALRASALAQGNVFVALMEASKVCSLGQISQALYEVGGQYRRNM